MASGVSVPNPQALTRAPPKPPSPQRQQAEARSSRVPFGDAIKTREITTEG